MALSNSPSFQTALQAYVAALSDDELRDFGPSSAEAVHLEMQRLNQNHYANSSSRRVYQRFELLIQFLSRYTSVIDTMVQYDTSPSALIWGILKLILETARSYGHYFEALTKMISKIGDVVSIYNRYENLLGQELSFQRALSDVYYDILVFLRKAKIVLKTNSELIPQRACLAEANHYKAARLVIRSIWRTFETDFQKTIDSLTRHTALLDAEITLLHRKNIEDDIKEGNNFREKTDKALDFISQSIVAHEGEQPTTRIGVDFENNEKQCLIKWLDPVDSREDYHCALQKRAKSTGQWFLEDRVISDWVTYSDEKPASPVVWVYGGPGFGKTILSATVIQRLLECTASPHERKLVYFYCNSSDGRNQSLLSILSTFLAQVVHCLPSRPAQLYSRYMESRTYGRNRIAIADEPLSLLKSLAATMKGLFIVIDGIDECLNPNEVALSLMSLCNESERIRLLCFSRDIPEVRSAFDSVANVELTASNLEEDISIYIKTQISRLPMDDPCIRDEIIARLSRDAGGMFLWVRLMLESLQNVTTIEDTKLVLKEFPTGIEHVYISILGRLNALSSQQQDLARRIYLWISGSTRLMSWEELQMALSFQQDIEAFSEDRKPFKNAVLELCYPLIEYREGHFTPIHASFKEFILGNCRSTGFEDGLLCDISEKEAHEEISGCCLACLSIPDVAENVNITSEAYPLARYATLNWCYHLLRSRQKPWLLQKALSFLSSASRRRTWMMRFLNMDKATFPLQTIISFQRNVYAWLNVDDADMGPSVQDVLSAKDILEDVQFSLFNIEQYRSQIIFNNKGTCSFDILIASRDLAREYTMSGQVEGGIEWFSNRVKEIQIDHGPKVLQKAWILNILGLLHDQIGNTDLAMEMQQQALAIQELQLPPNHLDMIWTINETGRLYRHQELCEESEKSHLRALKMLRTVLPEDDLQIVWTLNTLARTYRKQKRIDEAKALHQKALVSQQQRLGLQHPHALWTMTDIGRCLRDQGNLLAALEIHRKALWHRRETLGDLHADTLWSFNDVGIILEELGDVRKAWRHHRFALERQEASLGTSHKHTAWSRCAVKRLEEFYGM